MAQTPTIGTIPGFGNVGLSQHGSHATFHADLNFQPNFRMFDFVLEEEPPSPDLIDRVFNVPEGTAHYAERWSGGHYRCTPVWFPIIYSTLCVNLAYVRFHNNTPRKWRASCYPILFTMYMWHNGAGYMAREKHFLMDWWRNQSFAIDEMKRLRDEQRVREAIFSLDYIDDPIMEYKVKEWLTGNRTH